MSSPGLNYKCPKCSSTNCDVGELRGAGGFWSKIFDVQGARFTAVTCERCKYTEFFKAPTSMLGNILFRSVYPLISCPKKAAG